MAEIQKSDEIVVQSSVPRKGLMGITKDLYNDPFVKELILPMVKKEFGIGNTKDTEKEVTKKAFGRFMYALRDFIQGTWWVAVAFILSLGMVTIWLLWLKRRLGI